MQTSNGKLHVKGLHFLVSTTKNASFPTTDSPKFFKKSKNKFKQTHILKSQIKAQGKDPTRLEYPFFVPSRQIKNKKLPAIKELSLEN